VRLDPGQTRSIDFVLDDRSFVVWDPGQPDRPDLEARLGAGAEFVPAAGDRRTPGWYVDPDVYEILIGAASDDLHACTTIEVEGAR
jgi:hypothetical protein